MSLVLKNVSHEVGGEKYLDNVNLTLESGSFNVLLGRTLAGKTTLMRLMAGLEKPTSGQIFMNGHDVTGVAVQKRNVSMVYQQFINYPNLTVRENIASPLRLSKVTETEINRRVKETADMLQISQYLDRLPLELSGGQQQRTSMARALVKDASLILFDEPLVNLDYKLREELRSELRVLFEERKSIAVYATTEANEAMALGGVTTLVHEGRILQSGAVNQVYRGPKNIEAAKLFCEPPINLIEGQITHDEVSFFDSVHFPLDEKLKDLPKRKFIFGVKPSHIGLVPKNDDDLELPMKVELAEISGSETYLHVYNGQFSLILQLSGVLNYAIETPVNVYLPIHKLFVFDLNGLTIKVPTFDMENL